MRYQGHYIKKPKKSQMSDTPASKGKKPVLIILLVFLALILAAVVAVVIYWNTILSMMTGPQDITLPSMSDEEIEAMLNPIGSISNSGTSLDGAAPAETSPENTWPEVVSDQNITNIMLVGQASRAGEDYRLADSMILCSINRETNTLTLTSLQRDMRVVIPAYAGHTQGFNRINNVYHLGSYWTGEVKGSMEMLALCIEQNFGVKIDHTIEVDFESVEKIINKLGGVKVEISEAELKYLQDTIPEYSKNLTVGTNRLDGYQALTYARMRKIDGDRQRTERQREIITSVIDSVRDVSLMELHELATTVASMIVTDMTNSEITNYIFEFLPKLSDVKIQSQAIPFDGTYWSVEVDVDGILQYMIDCNLQKNGELLRESIGLVEAEEE